MPNYFDYLPDGDFTEDEMWEAIAISLNTDYNSIADGDLADYL